MGMEIPIFIDAIAAGATLAAVAVALYFGVKSLRHTRDIQQSERKHRLVKEIEEWAKELISFIDEYEIAAHESLIDETHVLWHTRQARWHILGATKSNMKEAANMIEKAFAEKVKNAVAAFDNLDKNINIGQPTTRNISNELERCKRSCEEILQSAGSVKFKEIR